MNAREVRDIVRTQFTIAIRSLDETEEDKENLKFDGGSMRVVLQMIQMGIVEDLYKLEANEIAKAVKEAEE